MDEDGCWWCYEAEPQQHDRGWYENEVGRTQRLKLIRQTDWQHSLQKVPG